MSIIVIEDWVAISVMWLGAMATGLVEAAFRETIENIQDRVAIVGTKMSDNLTITLIWERLGLCLLPAILFILLMTITVSK